MTLGQKLEGRKFDDNKFDPIAPLADDANLRLRVIKQMTSVNYTLYACLSTCGDGMQVGLNTILSQGMVKLSLWLP